MAPTPHTVPTRLRPVPRHGAAPLRGMRLFEGIPAQAVDELDRALPVVSWARGRPCPPALAAPGHLYLVRHGRLALTSRSSRGSRLVAAVLTSGDLYSSLRRSAPPPCEPQSPVAVSPLPASLLGTLVARAPSVALAMIGALGEQMVEATETAGVVSEVRVDQRLLRTFLRMAERDGVVTRAGVELRVDYTHAEWARLVGATREALTCAYLKLRRRGLVRTEGRVVILPHALLAEVGDLAAPDEPALAVSA
jgi:CRP-like cAMP-binding protein